MSGPAVSMTVRLLLVLVLLGALVGAIALGQGAQPEQRTGPVVVVRAPVLLPRVQEPDPPEPETVVAVGSLLRGPDAGSALPLLRIAFVDIEALCSRLFGREGWHVGEPLQPEAGEGAAAECTAERSFDGDEDGPASQSFAILRTRGGALREMRVKLNLYEDATRAQAASDAAAIVEDLLSMLRWHDLGEVAARSLAELQTSDRTSSGVRLRVFREADDEVARYNVLLSVAPSGFDEPADRWLPLSRAQHLAFERVTNPG